MIFQCQNFAKYQLSRNDKVLCVRDVQSRVTRLRLGFGAGKAEGAVALDELAAARVQAVMRDDALTQGGLDKIGGGDLLADSESLFRLVLRLMKLVC